MATRNADTTANDTGDAAPVATGPFGGTHGSDISRALEMLIQKYFASDFAAFLEIAKREREASAGGE